MRLWHRIRTDFFTRGLTDGRNAAFSSLPTAGVDNALVLERAQFAGAALLGRVGRVAPDDARNYRNGWVEGYSTMREQATEKAASPVA
ncbi:MAG: hypothetical protein ACLQUY_14195 [Ktedonobacterales bacterium]